jgi:hypothetical protein
MQRAEAARRGADQLIVTEAAIDVALREAGKLLSALTDFRLEAKLSALHGPSVVEDLGESIVSLGKARGAILKVHGGLAEVRDNIGCRTIAAGELDKPSNAPIVETLTLAPADDKQAA